MKNRSHLKYQDIKGILFDVDGTLYYQLPLRIIMIFLLVFFNILNPKEFFRKLKVIRCYRKSQEILRDGQKMPTENRHNQITLAAQRSGEPVAYVSGIIEEWFEKRSLPVVRLCRRRGLYRTIALLHEK